MLCQDSIIIPKKKKSYKLFRTFAKEQGPDNSCCENIHRQGTLATLNDIGSSSRVSYLYFKVQWSESKMTHNKFDSKMNHNKLNR